MRMQRFVKAGAWRTLESVWGKAAAITLTFHEPAGARIKLRYGYGWLGFDRQKQTLDGSPRSLSIDGWVVYVRFQIYVQSDTTVTFDRFMTGP